MIGSRIPRFLFYATTLGVIVAAIMLSMFYGQYRWLARQLVATSYEEHRVLLEASFERRLRADLHAIADMLPVDAGDENALLTGLERAMAANPDLVGLRYEDDAGQTWTSGVYPDVPYTSELTWLDEQLLMTYPVIRGERELGQVSGAIELTAIRSELDNFAAQLARQEIESRELSYLWIGGGTVAVLLLCGLVVWLLARSQTRRIRQLKAQAERFSDADFGEPLPETRGDELGALAAVFNQMRDRLRQTTHSRDYVDSILSGMNEAVIVTDDDGQIQRINEATTHLLGYAEDELLGTSIDFVVNSSKSASLANEPPSGLPREAMFESKFGESIPVSYTCSVVQSDTTATGNRIYAAQNITERRRAEKRIR